MKKQSLSKNMVFQFLYQGLILIIPLILSPYLTRTLRETAIGVYSYTNSIAYYFVILAMLGISRHGQRTISENAEDEVALRRAFWSLFTVHVLISILVLVLYFLFVKFFVQEDTLIYLIQAFYVLSALFDITWLFYGLENFKSVVIKNTLVKIIECVLIFVCVKTPGDLWKYTLITTVGLLLGQMVMLPQAIKLVPPIRFTRKDALSHIRPLLFFSISVIAVSLYTVFDKTLLGLLTTKDNVGFYEYSNKIITIPKTIIGVVGTVMFPRACKLAAQGDNEGQKKYIHYSLLFTSIIGMGATWGLCAVGRLFAVVYYGKSFAVCGSIIIALSPLIYIIGIGDILRTQYMIPNHLDRQFNICILLNALVNIILSISLIPVIGIYGAVVGTVSAEVFGVVFQLVICRKFLSYRDIVVTALPFFCFGFVMFLAINLIQSYLAADFFALLIEICVGVLIYMLFTGVYLFNLKKRRDDLGRGY